MPSTGARRHAQKCFTNFMNPFSTLFAAKFVEYFGNSVFRFFVARPWFRISFCAAARNGPTSAGIRKFQIVSQHVQISQFEISRFGFGCEFWGSRIRRAGSSRVCAAARRSSWPTARSPFLFIVKVLFRVCGLQFFNLRLGCIGWSLLEEGYYQSSHIYFLQLKIMKRTEEKRQENCKSGKTANSIAEDLVFFFLGVLCVFPNQNFSVFLPAVSVQHANEIPNWFLRSPIVFVFCFLWMTCPCSTNFPPSVGARGHGFPGAQL